MLNSQDFVRNLPYRKKDLRDRLILAWEREDWLFEQLVDVLTVQTGSRSEAMDEIARRHEGMEQDALN